MLRILWLCSGALLTDLSRPGVTYWGAKEEFMFKCVVSRPEQRPGVAYWGAREEGYGMGSEGAADQ